MSWLLTTLVEISSLSNGTGVLKWWNYYNKSRINAMKRVFKCVPQHNYGAHTRKRTNVISKIFNRIFKAFLLGTLMKLSSLIYIEHFKLIYVRTTKWNSKWWSKSTVHPIAIVIPNCDWRAKKKIQMFTSCKWMKRMN